jgi:hypothetical protein
MTKGLCLRAAYAKTNAGSDLAAVTVTISTKPGLVTVPGQPGEELAPGTLSSILKQAGGH